MKKSVFSLLLCIAVINLLTINDVLALPFGMKTMTHVNHAIKQQVRRAIIPILKSKNEKIEVPKIMAFSKGFQSLAFVTEGNYVSVWDLKQGKEYFNLPLNDIEPFRIAINHPLKELFIIDQQGKTYHKKIFTYDKLKELETATDIGVFNRIKTVKSAHILASNNRLIILPVGSSPIQLDFDSKVIDFDIGQYAQQLIVATANKVYLYNLQNIKQPQRIKNWDISQTIQGIILDQKTTSIAIRLESGFFSTAGYAWIRKQQDYQEIEYFTDSITDFVFTDNESLAVVTNHNEVYFRNINSGNIDKRLSLEKYNSEVVQLYQTDQFVFLPIRDKGILIVDVSSGEKLAQLVSTKNGWAVLDNSGRYDGNESAVADISWEADGEMLELDRFSKDYFEPGLLTKVIPQRVQGELVKPVEMITKPKNKLEEGLYLPPDVSLQITSNENQFNVSNTVNLTVVARAEDKIDMRNELRLFHNGKRLKNQDIIISESNNNDVKKWLLQIKPISGNNLFLAEVSGWGEVYGQSKLESFFVKAPRSKPETYIKSVGIDKYNGEELKLNYAVADARDLYGVISDYHDSQNGKVRGLREDQNIKTLLIDSQATKTEILAMLEQVKRSANPQDTLFLFMSGHGQVRDKQWYFLPQEAFTLRNGEHVKSVGISARELSETLVNIPNQKIVLILDSCQSGAVTDDFNNFQQRRDLSGLSKDSGIHILAATRADQLAPEYSQLGHGIFTYVLLNGLKKDAKGFYNADRWPKDGKVMVSELKKFTQKFVPVLLSILEADREKALASRGIAIKRTMVTPVGSSIGQDFQLFQ